LTYGGDQIVERKDNQSTSFDLSNTNSAVVNPSDKSDAASSTEDKSDSQLNQSDTISTSANTAVKSAEVESLLVNKSISSLLKPTLHSNPRPLIHKGFFLTPGHQYWELGLRVALGISKSVRHSQIFRAISNNLTNCHC